jgi:hypothetical protein
MPIEVSADTDYIALATFHRFDKLVTWNSQHIANTSKFPRIRRDLQHETAQTPQERAAYDHAGAKKLRGRTLQATGSGLIAQMT